MIGCQEITKSRDIIFSTQQSVRIPMNIAFFLSQPLKPMPAKKPSLYFHTCKRMRRHIFFCRKSSSTDGSIKKSLLKKRLSGQFPFSGENGNCHFIQRLVQHQFGQRCFSAPDLHFFLLKTKSEIPKKGQHQDSWKLFSGNTGLYSR